MRAGGEQREARTLPEWWWAWGSTYGGLAVGSACPGWIGPGGSVLPTRHEQHLVRRDGQPDQRSDELVESDRCHAGGRTSTAVLHAVARLAQRAPARQSTSRELGSVLLRGVQRGEEPSPALWMLTAEQGHAEPGVQQHVVQRWMYVRPRGIDQIRQAHLSVDQADRLVVPDAVRAELVRPNHQGQSSQGKRNPRQDRDASIRMRIGSPGKCGHDVGRRTTS